MKYKFITASMAAVFAIGFAHAASAGDFSFTFEWGGIRSCTDGMPNTVSNPIFTLSNVPKGTKKIKFAMEDTDVPDYDHGGGTAAFTGKNVIQPGAFKYQSPCPPGETHKYKWKAWAKNASGDTIGQASASKNYP